MCQAPDIPSRQQTATIQRDRKRRKGKTVTVISGLKHNPAAFKELLTMLKTTCGAGGAYKDGVLEIQGDQREKVAEKLRELGYKVKFSGG
jgi:translation initiation factor 1